MKTADHGPVRVLTFDRPEKLNAFNAELASGARDAVRAAAADGAVRAIVLTGEGRAFSAGVDLEWLNEFSGGQAGGTASSEPVPTVELVDAVRNCDKPVIAAVNGLAVGIGTSICLHVDLVVAAESARFRTPFTKLGVAPEFGLSWLLPHQMGHQRGSWMLLSSEWVDASTAVEWGLAFEAVPDDALVARAVELGQTIAAHNPESVAAVKRTLRAAREASIDAANALEMDEFGALMRSSSGFQVS